LESECREAQDLESRRAEIATLGAPGQLKTVHVNAR
jgi:hypothetical protein